MRQETYGVVKKALLEALLAFERVSPGAVTVAAGRCEQCEVCTRLQDLPLPTPGTDALFLLRLWIRSHRVGEGAARHGSAVGW